jgi:tetratricopeptide (TPR) repeat protein
VDFTVYHDVLHGSSIARRWQEVVAESVPDFDERFKVAKAGYLASRASFSDNADTFHDAGMKLLRAGLYAEAIEQFSKALVRNPKRNNSHFNIGSCYERLGKYEAALTEYQAELAVDPTDEDVPFRIGRTQYRLKRHAEAVESLTIAISKAPSGSVYYYRGLAYAALGNVASARADLNKARSLKYDDEAVTRALDELRTPARP